MKYNAYFHSWLYRPVSMFAFLAMIFTSPDSYSIDWKLGRFNELVSEDKGDDFKTHYMNNHIIIIGTTVYYQPDANADQINHQLLNALPAEICNDAQVFQWNPQALSLEPITQVSPQPAQSLDNQSLTEDASEAETCQAEVSGYNSEGESSATPTPAPAPAPAPAPTPTPQPTPVNLAAYTLRGVERHVRSVTTRRTQKQNVRVKITDLNHQGYNVVYGHFYFDSRGTTIKYHRLQRIIASLSGYLSSQTQAVGFPEEAFVFQENNNIYNWERRFILPLRPPLLNSFSQPFQPPVQAPSPPDFQPFIFEPPVAGSFLSALLQPVSLQELQHINSAIVPIVGVYLFNGYIVIYQNFLLQPPGLFIPQEQIQQIYFASLQAQGLQPGMSEIKQVIWVSTFDAYHHLSLFTAYNINSLLHASQHPLAALLPAGNFQRPLAAFPPTSNFQRPPVALLPAGSSYNAEPSTEAVIQEAPCKPAEEEQSVNIEPTANSPVTKVSIDTYLERENIPVLNCAEEEGYKPVHSQDPAHEPREVKAVINKAVMNKAVMNEATGSDTLLISSAESEDLLFKPKSRPTLSTEPAGRNKKKRRHRKGKKCANQVPHTQVPPSDSTGEAAHTQKIIAYPNNPIFTFWQRPDIILASLIPIGIMAVFYAAQQLFSRSLNTQADTSETESSAETTNQPGKDKSKKSPDPANNAKMKAAAIASHTQKNREQVLLNEARELTVSFNNPLLTVLIDELYEFNTTVLDPIFHRRSTPVKPEQYKETIKTYHPSDFQAPAKMLYLQPVGQPRPFTQLVITDKIALLKDFSPRIRTLYDAIDMDPLTSFHWLMLLCGIPHKQISRLGCHDHATKLLLSDWHKKPEHASLLDSYLALSSPGSGKYYLFIPAWPVEKKLGIAQEPLLIPMIHHKNQLKITGLKQDYSKEHPSIYSVISNHNYIDLNQLEFLTPHLTWNKLNLSNYFVCDDITQDRCKQLAFDDLTLRGKPNNTYVYLLLKNNLRLDLHPRLLETLSGVWYEVRCEELSTEQAKATCHKLLKKHKIAYWYYFYLTSNPNGEVPRFKLVPSQAGHQEQEQISPKMRQLFGGSTLVTEVLLVADSLVRVDSVSAAKFELFYQAFERAIVTIYPEVHISKYAQDGFAMIHNAFQACGFIPEKNALLNCIKLDLEYGLLSDKRPYSQYGKELPEYYPDLPGRWVRYLPMIRFYRTAEGQKAIKRLTVGQLIENGFPRDILLASHSLTGQITMSYTSDKKPESISIPGDQGIHELTLGEQAICFDDPPVVYLQEGFLTGTYAIKFHNSNDEQIYSYFLGEQLNTPPDND